MSLQSDIEAAVGGNQAALRRVLTAHAQAISKVATAAGTTVTGAPGSAASTPMPSAPLLPTLHVTTGKGVFNIIIVPGAVGLDQHAGMIRQEPAYDLVGTTETRRRRKMALQSTTDAANAGTLFQLESSTAADFSANVSTYGPSSQVSYTFTVPNAILYWRVKARFADSEFTEYVYATIGGAPGAFNSSTVTLDDLSDGVFWRRRSPAQTGVSILVGGAVRGPLSSGVGSTGTSGTIYCLSSFTVSSDDGTYTITPLNTSITGLAAPQAYWVYFDYPNGFGSCSPTIHATSIESDLRALPQRVTVGYVTIGAPNSGGGGATTMYRPTTYSDLGGSGTDNPPAAYDGSLSSVAVVEGAWNGIDGSTNCLCLWKGFPNFTSTPTTATLKVAYDTSYAGTSHGVIQIRYSLDNGASYATAVSNVNVTSLTTFSLSLSTAQILSDVIVLAQCSTPTTTPANHVDIYEIWVETT